MQMLARSTPAWLSLSTALAVSAHMYSTVSLSKIVSSNGNCPRALSELARQLPLTRHNLELAQAKAMWPSSHLLCCSSLPRVPEGSAVISDSALEVLCIMLPKFVPL